MVLHKTCLNSHRQALANKASVTVQNSYGMLSEHTPLRQGVYLLLCRHRRSYSPSHKFGFPIYGIHNFTLNTWLLDLWESGADAVGVAGVVVVAVAVRVDIPEIRGIANIGRTLTRSARQQSVCFLWEYNLFTFYFSLPKRFLSEVCTAYSRVNSSISKSDHSRITRSLHRIKLK